MLRTLTARSTSSSQRYLIPSSPLCSQVGCFGGYSCWGGMASHSSIGAARQHSRILFVKNLNYNTTGADLYQVFGRYGAIRQIRLGDATGTKGTAYVVYEEMADAKRALDNLNGFHLSERYIVVLYHMPARLAAKADLARREAELADLKAFHKIADEA